MSRLWCHVLEREVSMTPATVAERRTEQTTDKTAIRPFRFQAPEPDLIELRRRITATRFPETETVADFFGVFFMVDWRSFAPRSPAIMRFRQRTQRPRGAGRASACLSLATGPPRLMRGSIHAKMGCALPD